VTARLLHRDLSMANVMAFIPKNGVPQAILIDYDLSVVLLTNWGTPQASSKHRTGTAAFMARELLTNISNQFEHCYAHDLESFYYILVWTILGYGRKTMEGDPLKGWKSRNWEDIADCKDSFVSTGWLGRIKHIHADHSHSRGVYLAMGRLFMDATHKGTVTAMQFVGGDVESEQKRLTALHDTLVEEITWKNFSLAMGLPLQTIDELDDPPAVAREDQVDVT
jgi:serine/threonine protein kinase